MRPATLGALLLSSALACGGVSVKDSGHSGRAGASAAGGSGGESATGGSGGSGGQGGSAAGVGGCGVCPPAECAPAFAVFVYPTNRGLIVDLQAHGDFEVSCSVSTTSPCQWTCESALHLPAGPHSITLSAPGFEDLKIDFSVPNPGDCGCCGCPCSPSIGGVEVLAGEGVAECCADRTNDPLNCGACGQRCSTGVCVGGQCDD